MLQKELNKIKESTGSEIEKLSSELKITKERLLVAESDRNDKTLELEKNKTLLENKIQHLTVRYEENNQQKQESINSLTQLVDGLRKDKQNQQITTESNFNERINQQDRLYREQISKLTEKSKTEIQQLTMKTQKYEMEAKNLREKLAISQQNSQNKMDSLERKISEMTTAERKIQN